MSSTAPHDDDGLISGFFAGLVDFRFTRYVGPRVLSVIYTLAFALVVIVAVILFFTLVSQGAAGALIAIVVVPIGTLLYLTLIRVSLELYSAILRTAENTDRAARLLEASLTGGPRPPAPPAAGPSLFGGGPAPAGPAPYGGGPAPAGPSPYGGSPAPAGPAPFGGGPAGGDPAGGSGPSPYSSGPTRPTAYPGPYSGDQPPYGGSPSGPGYPAANPD